MSGNVDWDALLARKQREIDAILREREADRQIDIRFGPGTAYPDASVLMWTRRFDSGPDTVYQYAAIKVGDGVGLWFLTGRWQAPMIWSRLVREHLSKAEQVWYATEWEEI